MARPAAQDPIEKFRFEVTVLVPKDYILSPISLTTASAPTILKFPLLNIQEETFNSTGFSEVVIPKADITEVTYRENVDAPNLRKQPGLLRYENLILRKGVTINQDLYNWFISTQNAVLSISSPLTSVTSGFSEFSVIPTQETFYRKDLAVSVKDRTGKYIKHWLFYNCFIVGYKPGNDLNANADEKLIEELSISFEVMFEAVAPTISEALSNVNDQVLKQFGKAALSAVL